MADTSEATLTLWLNERVLATAGRSVKNLHADFLSGELYLQFILPTAGLPLVSGEHVDTAAADKEDSEDEDDEVPRENLENYRRVRTVLSRIHCHDLVVPRLLARHTPATKYLNLAILANLFHYGDRAAKQTAEKKGKQKVEATDAALGEKAFVPLHRRASVPRVLRPKSVADSEAPVQVTDLDDVISSNPNLQSVAVPNAALEGKKEGDEREDASILNADAREGVKELEDALRESRAHYQAQSEELAHARRLLQEKTEGAMEATRGLELRLAETERQIQRQREAAEREAQRLRETTETADSLQERNTELQKESVFFH